MKLANNQRSPWARPAGLISILMLAGLIGLLSGCAGSGGRDGPGRRQADSRDMPDAIPRVEPKSRYGNPETYVVRGKRYRTMDSSSGHVERGVASWYGKKFHGRKTSSGERYDMYAMTAAHKSLPLPTYAKVTNLENGRTAVVRINDRGPFHGTRVIDLSYAAARKLDVVAKGTASVEVRSIDPRRPASDRGPLLAEAGGTLSRRSKPESRRASPRGGATAAKSRGAAAAPAGARLAQTAVPARSRPEDRPAREIPMARPEKAVESARAEPQDEAHAQVARTGVPVGSEPIVAAATQAASGPSLYLQVGAFGSRTNAEQLRRQLVEKLAAQVSVRTISGESSPLYKVHVGPFDSREKARDASLQVASLGVRESHVVAE